MLFNNGVGGSLASTKVLYSKRHKGFLVRLIHSQHTFFVNVFTPSGSLHSQSFKTLASANSFLHAFIKSLKKC